MRLQKIMNMKKSSRYIFSLVLATILASCTGDFAEINTDPTKSTPSNFDANYFLSNAEWNHLTGIWGYAGPILFQSGWVQTLASTSTLGASYYSNADRYVQSTNTNSYLASTWNNCYRAASLANEAVKLSVDKPELVNLHAAATIIKILSIHVISDTYGDAPYTQALQASTGVTLPVYDSQQELYPMLLADLEKAINEFDESKPKPNSDIFPYKGDIPKWRKFGYSLMLRMAMRLTKVSESTAKTYAEKAAGKTFTSVADDAVVIGDVSNYTNGNGTALVTAADFYEVRWSKTFIDYLRDNNDPRLGIVAEVPQAGLAANQNTALAGDDDPSIQVGLPNGYDLKGGATDVSNEPDYPGSTGAGADKTPIGNYSRPKTSLYGQKNAAFFVVTYAQTELLLAEAKVRGFSVGTTTAAQHYHNGVEAALLTLAPLGAGAVVVPGDASAFADASPLAESTKEASLAMINTQYWATTSTLMDFSEAWSNWRRSGYPNLTPVNYTGNFSGGTIPRRQPYPTTEPTLNPANYQTAAGRLQGGDTWTSRIWWDQ